MSSELERRVPAGGDSNGAGVGWRPQAMQQQPPATPQSGPQGPVNMEAHRNSQPIYVVQGPPSFEHQMSQHQPQLVQYTVQQGWQGNGGNASGTMVPALQQGASPPTAGAVVVAQGTNPLTPTAVRNYTGSQGVEFRSQAGSAGMPIAIPTSASWTATPPTPGQSQVPQQHQAGQTAQGQIQGQQLQGPTQQQQQQVHVQQAPPGQEQQPQLHQQGQHGPPAVMYYTTGGAPLVQPLAIGQMHWQQQQQLHHRQPPPQLHFSQFHYPNYHGNAPYKQEDSGSMGRNWEAMRRDKKRVRAEEPDAAISMSTSKGTPKGRGGAGKFVKAQRRSVEGPSPFAPLGSDTIGDGVPYAPPSREPENAQQVMSPESKLSKKIKKNKAKAALQAAVAMGTGEGGQDDGQEGRAEGSDPVTDADRSAGEGHWGNLLKAGAIQPVKRESPDEEQQQPTQASGTAGGPSAAPMLAPVDLEKMDPLAYSRMFPGGAVMNIKGFDVRGKSAVSAAFELCVCMDPKTRPKFEFKDGVKGPAPFTLYVEVHGVQYTEATAKSVKLAKQLAAINFLKEVIGNRMNIDFSKLLQDGAGGAMATAAMKAANDQAASDQGKRRDGGGGSKGDKYMVDAVTRAALGDGKANYAQLLHDLVAAHHETPTYASYAFMAHKEMAKDKEIQEADPSLKGFRCTAKLLRHVVNAEATSKAQEEEKAAKEKADKAREMADSDPNNADLAAEAEGAAKALEACKSGPKLDILVLNTTGDGPSKREAKHKAAENMIYLLLPQCKTDEEMRAEAKRVMDEYHVEKKARMEEEQRVAQEMKAKREAAEAAARMAREEAKKAGRKGVRQGAKAASSEDRGDKDKGGKEAAHAARKSSEDGVGAAAEENGEGGESRAQAAEAAANATGQGHEGTDLKDAEETADKSPCQANEDDGGQPGPSEDQATVADDGQEVAVEARQDASEAETLGGKGGAGVGSDKVDGTGGTPEENEKGHARGEGTTPEGETGADVDGVKGDEQDHGAGAAEDTETGNSGGRDNAPMAVES